MVLLGEIFSNGVVQTLVGGLLAGAAGLIALRVGRRNEHAKWLRERRLEVFVQMIDALRMLRGVQSDNAIAKKPPEERSLYEADRLVTVTDRLRSAEDRLRRSMAEGLLVFPPRIMAAIDEIKNAIVEEHDDAKLNAAYKRAASGMKDLLDISE